MDALVFSPDGTWLASSGASHEISVWDVESGKRIMRLGGHQRDVVALEVSQDGGRLVSASLDGEVRWWDVARARTVAMSMGHRGNVTGLRWTGDRLLSGSYDMTFRVWGLPVGVPLTRLSAPTSSGYRFDVSPDGARLTAAGVDGLLRTWSVADGRLLGTTDVGEPTVTAAVEPDGAWYAVGARSGRVFLVRASDGVIVQRIDAHTHIVYGLAWSRDGQNLALR